MQNEASCKIAYNAHASSRYRRTLGLQRCGMPAGTVGTACTDYLRDGIEHHARCARASGYADLRHRLRGIGMTHLADLRAGKDRFLLLLQLERCAPGCGPWLPGALRAPWRSSYVRGQGRSEEVGATRDMRESQQCRWPMSCAMARRRGRAGLMTSDGYPYWRVELDRVKSDCTRLSGVVVVAFRRPVAVLVVSVSAFSRTAAASADAGADIVC